MSEERVWKQGGERVAKGLVGNKEADTGCLGPIKIDARIMLSNCQ